MNSNLRAFARKPVIRVFVPVIRVFVMKVERYLARTILPALVLRQNYSWGGYKSDLGKWGDNIRIGALTEVNNPKNMFLEGDNFIWNYSILDAVSDKIYIGRNTQIGAYVGIFTHSTHISIRLAQEQGKGSPGYQHGPVKIGRYCFVGSGAKILHGVTVGDNAIVGVNSVVGEDVPAFSIVGGIPAKIMGDTRKLDERYRVAR